MKAKWTKEFPKQEGWYWVSFKGKHGIKVTPAYAERMDDTLMVHVGSETFFRGPDLPDQIKQYKMSFGPTVPDPDKTDVITDLLSTTDRLIKAAASLDNLHHAGIRPRAADWSELFSALNFSRAALGKAKE